MLALELGAIATVCVVPWAWVIWWFTHDSTQYPDRPRREHDEWN